MLSRILRPRISPHLERVAYWLHRLGLTPNGLTVMGFVLTLVAAWLLVMGQLRWGGIVLLLAASFDMLDGSLARYANQVSKFGAFLDSTLDRYSESAILLALALHYARVDGSTGHLYLILILLTLVGSWMVSYTRARAEGLQIECKVGILQRPERVILLLVGLITGWMGPILWILAIFTNVTALQRIYEVYLRTNRPANPPAQVATDRS